MVCRLPTPSTIMLISTLWPCVPRPGPRPRSSRRHQSAPFANLANGRSIQLGRAGTGRFPMSASIRVSTAGMNSRRHTDARGQRRAPKIGLHVRPVGSRSYTVGRVGFKGQFATGEPTKCPQEQCDIIATAVAQRYALDRHPQLGVWLRRCPARPRRLQQALRDFSQQTGQVEAVVALQPPIELAERWPLALVAEHVVDSLKDLPRATSQQIVRFVQLGLLSRSSHRPRWYLVRAAPRCGSFRRPVDATSGGDRALGRVPAGAIARRVSHC